MSNVDACVDAVFGMFERHGNQLYLGESVSQTSHMIQTAMAAEKAGQPPEVILGSMLHDIGNLVGHDQPEVEMLISNDVNIGPKDHDALGEQFLKQHGVPFEIYCFARGHVNAVRYMAWKDKNYKDSVHWTSQKTLERRGGPFNDAEAAEFEKLPHYEAIVQCRGWDENAKDPNAALEPLGKYKNMMKNYLLSKV